MTANDLRRRARRGSEHVSRISRFGAQAKVSVLIHIGAECKRHKIKCEQVTGEIKCAKCLRSGAECVPHNMNQRLLDEDTAYVVLFLAAWLLF
jgi:hypothetical protein